MAVLFNTQQLLDLVYNKETCITHLNNVYFVTVASFVVDKENKI